MKRLTILFTAVGVCSVLVAVGQGQPPKKNQAVPRHFEVRMVGGNAFNPPAINVGVGDTITWINDDETLTHTATSDDGGTTFDTKNVGPLAHSTRVNKFTKTGTIPYHCEKHPGTMKGKVTVVAKP